MTNKYVNTPEGVLVRIKNKINLAMHINTQTLKLYIDSYVSSKYNKSSTKAHFDKVNAYVDFCRDKMTIKVFFKYLRVLRIKKISFTITVTTARGHEVTVTEDIHMAVQELDLDEETPTKD